MKIYKIQILNLITIILIFISLSVVNRKNKNNLRNKHTTLNNSCYFIFDETYKLKSSGKLQLPSTFENVLNKFKWHQTTNFYDAKLIFLNNFNDFDKLSNIPYSKNAEWIYGFRSINMLASKSVLALTLRVKNQTNLIPKTWILSNDTDFQNLLTEFDNHGNCKIPMILKKNVQKQKGITFLQNRKHLQQQRYQHTICQELLYNPYLINKRKVNLRVYVLLIFQNHSYNAYMYNDGFIYYTKEPFLPNVITHEKHITTGYIDRMVYKSNPLTIQDLYTYMNKKYEQTLESELLKTNIEKLIRNTIECYDELFRNNECKEYINRFTILGCDVAPDNNLNAKLMEINKGPDLTMKDERDGILKYKMVKNAFCKCGLIKSTDRDEFVKLI